MQAILNGLTGSGLLLDESGGSVLHFEDGLLPFAARKDELRNVLGEARHIDFVNVADASEAREILNREHLREESLDLTLILLDPELSFETRAEAAALLNHMLLDWDLRSWLEGVLYGAPLPANADMQGALRNARGVNGNAVIAMLSRLSDLQPAIGRVQEAWNSVCARYLPSPDAQQEATVLVARNGVFRLAVHAYEGKSSDDFRFAALRVLQPIAEHRRIVEELTSELRLHQADRRVPRLRTEDDQTPEHAPFDRSVSLEIQRRKDAIVGFMRAARLDLVQRHVNQLVDYQLPFDRRGEYTSKSLCDLAMEAKSLELFELQLELAHRAVSVCYEDGWAWAQVGDAFLILNKFEEALNAYQHASEFNDDAIGRRGYALVLLRMGRAEESLAAYEDAIRDYPTDAVAQAGRAEVLKSMGRLDDALTAYDTVVREFPSNVVARTGRAEVLKSMGQLGDALAAYDAVVREFPSNVIARNGRAEVLKSMGQLDDALAAYDAVLREFPSNLFARNGRAEVLKSMGQLDNALVAYDAVVREFPSNVIARAGRAELLKSMGQLDDALAAYDAVVREFPNNVIARTGRAEVLKSMGQLDDALAAYDAVVCDFPSDVVARTGRAEVLKSMGQLDDALDAYDAVVREFPSHVVSRSGRAEVLKSMGHLDDALAHYDAVVREFPSDVVARNGRAEVLKSMGRLDVALTAYRAIVQEFPSNAVAKTGLAAVLCALGRYDEVLAVIPNESPRTPTDWVAFHIRGMAMLRAGRIDEASTIFLRGSLENPFVADRDVFKRGLGLTRICERAYDAALNILSSVREIRPDPVLGLLRGHSAGALGDLGGAARFLSATGPRNDRERDVKAELERRFVRSEPPLHDDEWLRQCEVDCVLLAA
jgi:tetratricopeptide (TPR) repeat protein